MDKLNILDITTAIYIYEIIGALVLSNRRMQTEKRYCPSLVLCLDISESFAT
jgi:hypothetical protein